MGPKLKISVIIFSVAIGCAVALALLEIYHSGENNAAGSNRVAIVYGNKVNEDGTPSERLRARLDAAYALFEKGIVSKILVSGGVGKERQDEAVVMGMYLRDKGLSLTDVMVDSKGATSALTSKNAARMLGNVPVVAVSQRYHLCRAKMSLRNNGFTDVQGYAPLYTEWRDIYAYLREVPAVTIYWATEK